MCTTERVHTTTGNSGEQLDGGAAANARRARAARGRPCGPRAARRPRLHLRPHPLGAACGM